MARVQNVVRGVNVPRKYSSQWMVDGIIRASHVTILKAKICH
jgi:hypothetical protein